MKKKIWLSLITVIVFAVVILLFSYKMGLTYHQNNLTKGDSTYYYYFSGTVLQEAKANGILRAIMLVATYPGNNTILHYLVVAILSPILPLDTSIGVILNSIWYLFMAASLSIFFWRKTESIILSIFLPIPMLIAGLPLIDVYQGLTDLHVNLLGYTLGVSIMCFVLLSDYLHKPKPTIVAGIFLGLLMLGRIHSVALVGIALAPYVLKGLFFSSNLNKRKTFWGLAILGSVSFLISGWWIIPRLSAFLLPFQWYGVPRGSLGIVTTYDSAWIWVNIVLGFFLYGIAYYPLALVLSWIPGTQVVSSRKIWFLLKRINWLYIWMGISPLLILILMRSDYKYYGWPALFGIYLSVIFLFRVTEKELQPLKNPVFLGLLLVAMFGAIFGFMSRMVSTHTTIYTDKQSALQAVDAIIDDAGSSKVLRDEIRVGMAYYGSLNPGTLADVIIFDKECPASIQLISLDTKVPSLGDCQSIFLPESITQDPTEWELEIMGDEMITVKKAFEEISSEADYVIILSPASWDTTPPMYPEYWSEWVELSQQLHQSEAFHPITTSLTITHLEKIIVLARGPETETQ